MSPQPEQREEAMIVLERMISLLGHQLEIHSDGEQTDRFALTLSTDDPGRIIGRKGHYLRSLELVLNRVLRKKHRQFPWVELDVDGYRRRRSRKGAAPQPLRDPQRLEGMARDVAREVTRWGQSKKIGPLSAAETEQIRRLLAEYPNLEVVPAADERHGKQHLLVQIVQAESR